MDQTTLIAKFDSHSVEETIGFGEQFAFEHMHVGSVVALFGELASGKTHFTKGIARAFGIDEHDLSSPTFALANEYPITFVDGELGTLFHLDCYRFERPEELLELGVEEYVYPYNAMTVIEWAERIAAYLPSNRIDIRFETLAPNERCIIVTKNLA